MDRQRVARLKATDVERVAAAAGEDVDIFDVAAHTQTSEAESANVGRAWTE